MREIKFRGKLEFSSGWIVGGYCQWRDIRDNAKHQIISNVGFHNDVKPETVGQFTGLKDKNGVDIYEGDKLLDYEIDPETKEDISLQHPVVYDTINCQFTIDNSYKRDGSSLVNIVEYFGINNLEVVGNIYENPELCK